MSVHAGVIGWLENVADLVRVDLLQFFRSRMVVASTALTSITMLLAFGLGADAMHLPHGVSSRSYFAFMLPGIVALGNMFSSTYTAGYAFIVDRQKRTVEDIVLSPLSYAGFVVGRLVGSVFKCSLQFVLAVLLAVTFFDASVRSWGGLGVAFLCEALFFSAFGMLVATSTNEISFANIVNFVLVPLTYFSGIFFPLEGFGQWAELVAAAPLAVFIDLHRDAFAGTEPAHLSRSYSLGGAYVVTSLVAAIHAFRSRVQEG